MGYFNGVLRFWLGWAQEVAGDNVGAQETWRQARRELEAFLKEQPYNFLLIGDLALTNMGLGDKTAALALSERAMAANPVEKDAVAGPIPIEVLARVAARMGARPRHRRLTATTFDTVQWSAGCRHPAYACDAPTRSDVRSAPGGPALPRTCQRRIFAQVAYGG